MTNYTKEVLEILEKLGNKDLNLCLPSRSAHLVLSLITKYQNVFVGKDVKMRAKLAQICPESLIIAQLDRNDIKKRKDNLKEDDEYKKFKEIALDLAMAYNDLKDMKAHNQSLPLDQKEEAEKRVDKFEKDLTEKYEQLTGNLLARDEEIMSMAMQGELGTDYSGAETHLVKISEALGVGDKVLDLNMDEQKLLFNTIKTLNSFR